ncbi:MAG: hypothetical protein VCF07_11060 [Nitrospinota bacterium]
MSESESAQPRLVVFDSEFELLRFDLDEGAGYVLLGDVDFGGAGRIFEAFEADPGRGGPVELMMEEAELTDGLSVTRMVDAVRLLVDRFDQVRLIRSPQMLAHSIYRLGMLTEGSRLELVEPREEEGEAS